MSAGAFSARALSGLPIEALTLEAAVGGGLSPADLRVHPDTLRHQAEVAETHGNPQLGENLRRAAELTALPDDEVLAIYEALRPGQVHGRRPRGHRRPARGRRRAPVRRSGARSRGGLRPPRPASVRLSHTVAAHAEQLERRRLPARSARRRFHVLHPR